jgi:hypothetical protein
MKGINVGRWIIGGIAAGVLIWLMEGAGSVLYMEDMEAAMKAHNLSMEMSLRLMVISIVVSLLSGLVLIFFYAAARPRFGPGAKTALIVAVAFWFGGYLPSLIGFSMMGLFPNNLLLQWGIVGLVEMVVASLLGGWLYRE